MAKKNAKQGQSNQTKAQSSKKSVTMEEEKTSETVVEETDIGKKKLIRHQEKIKREEEELKRIQAEKQKKEEAAEKSKKSSKNKASKSKNKEKSSPVLNMSEKISIIKNTENVEKTLEKPIETPIECVTPPIKTLFVKPGAEKEWVEQRPHMREDWNDIIKNEEEPITDDEKIQQQTGSGNSDTELNETERPRMEYHDDVKPSNNDRGSSHRGPDRKNNQNQKNFVQAEYRRGGGGGNYYNERSRRGSGFSNHGQHSNYPSRYNNPRYSTSNDSQNLEEQSNARPSSRASQDDRSHSKETRNSNPRQQSFNRGSSNRSSNEFRNVDRHSKSHNIDSPECTDTDYKQKISFKDNDGGSSHAPRHSNKSDNRHDFKRNFNQNDSNYSSKSTYYNQDRKSTDASRHQNRRGQNKNYNPGSYHNSQQSYDDSKRVEGCEILTWGEPEQSQQQTTSGTSNKNWNNEYSSNVNNISDVPSENDPETTDTSTDEVNTSVNQSGNLSRTPMQRTGIDQIKTYISSDQSSRSSDDDFKSSKRNSFGQKNKSDNWGNAKSSPNYSFNNSKTNSEEWKSSAKRWSAEPNYMWAYNENDKEFEEFLECKKKFVICHGKLKEEIGDLFNAPDTYSLAHCVAEDLSMGAGIAVHFRSMFGSVGDLLNQEQRTGGLAVLENKKRFIYYLITKERSNGKPTYYTLWKSLQKLRNHCVEHGVRNLAIPQIGCGLDRLNWHTVKQSLEHVFRDVDIEIVVYKLDELEPSSKKPKKGFVTHAKLQLRDIEPLTGLIYLGTENAAKTMEIESLGEKHNFIHAYTSALKKTGGAIRTIVGKEYIYGLIARKTITDKFDFVALENSLRELRKMLREDRTNYIGIQAFEHLDSTLIVDKILSLLQYILAEVDIWVCWPPALEQYCPQFK